MSVHLLSRLIFVGGLIHFSILVASSLVPLRLNWKEELKGISRLHRQMYWTYGGYVVMAIIAFGCISVTCSNEIAHGSLLARGFCIYVSIFWAIRLLLQSVFDVKEHLTAWWLTLGYHLLSVLFVCLVLIYGIAALGMAR